MQRRSVAGSSRRAVLQDDAESDITQFVWTDGSGDRRNGVGMSEGGTADDSDRKADREHADLHFGREARAGADRSAGRGVHRRSGSGGWIYERAGIDGGTIW